MFNCVSELLKKEHYSSSEDDIPVPKILSNPSDSFTKTPVSDNKVLGPRSAEQPSNKKNSTSAVVTYHVSGPTVGRSTSGLRRSQIPKAVMKKSPMVTLVTARKEPADRKTLASLPKNRNETKTTSGPMRSWIPKPPDDNKPLKRHSLTRQNTKSNATDDISRTRDKPSTNAVRIQGDNREFRSTKPFTSTSVPRKPIGREITARRRPVYSTTQKTMDREGVAQPAIKSSQRISSKEVVGKTRRNGLINGESRCIKPQSKASGTVVVPTPNKTKPADKRTPAVKKTMRDNQEIYEKQIPAALTLIPKPPECGIPKRGVPIRVRNIKTPERPKGNVANGRVINNHRQTNDNNLHKAKSNLGQGLTGLKREQMKKNPVYHGPYIAKRVGIVKNGSSLPRFTQT